MSPNEKVELEGEVRRRLDACLTIAFRGQVEAEILAEAAKDAQIIRADAEAEAARIYAESYGKDPGFYDFYRAMQSYRQTFLSEGADTNIVMSPGNEYLRKFETGK